MGTLGGVSSEHPMASIAGMKVLSNGGNAIDATVATSLSLAVTQPHLGSLGSDFFALIYESSSGKIHCLNASGWIRHVGENWLRPGIAQTLCAARQGNRLFSTPRFRIIFH